MKIAVPIAENKLCLHFGHCEVFGFYEVDEVKKKIIGKEYLNPPPHQPGVLPPWIKNKGADIVITGGMGNRAQDLFKQAGVQVITGASPQTPDELVISYLNNSLQLGDNVCDH